MNGRQVRFGIDIFTGLVVASVGVALAGLTWHLAGYSGAPLVAAAVTGATGEPVDIGGLLALVSWVLASGIAIMAEDDILSTEKLCPFTKRDFFRTFRVTDCDMLAN